MSEQRDAAEGAVDAESPVVADPEGAETESGTNGRESTTGPAGHEAAGSGDSEEETAASDAEAAGSEEDAPSPPRTQRALGPALAAVTALVVLVASAAGYYTVVPGTVKVPSRLASLVVTRPGIKAFDVKPKAHQKLTPAQSGIAAIKSAAKTSPDQTGGYLVGWEPASSKVAVAVAFVLPTEAQAVTALTQLRHQQLAADAEKANSLTRKATFEVSTVPGSAGALFAPKGGTASSPGLALVAFRVGNVVSETEVSGTAQARHEASTLATLQYVHLGRVQPRFSLTKMTYPLLETILWGAGTVLLVALIAASPFLRRRRRARMERRRQEELDRQLVLGGTVVMKHRR